MRKWLALFCFFPSLCVYAGSHSIFNMGYVEVNTNQLSTAGCYIRTDNNKPFFKFVSVFAANINGYEPNKPEIYFNPQVDALLNHTNQVSVLQSKGIKVLLTLLGNHQNAGWSCMTDAKAIATFANNIVKTINNYHFDGVDIDDEYSICTPNETSMIRIAQAIKHHPQFQGKIVSKALLVDDQYFAANYKGHKLAEYLDYGWEMSYDYTNYESRLASYVQYGVQKNNLALGESTHDGSQPAINSANYIMQNNYGGMMVYDVTNGSREYLSALAQAEFKTDVMMLPNCQ